MNRRGTIRQRGQTFTAMWDEQLRGFKRTQRSQGGFRTRLDAEVFLAKKLDRPPDYRYEGQPPLVHSVVYFIQEGDAGPIKIGYTTDRQVSERLTTCQTGNPRRLVLRATTPGDRRLELALHERFADYRMRGEWFAPTPDLLDLVDSFRLQDVDKAA